MPDFTVTYTNAAKIKMEEAYDLTGQDLINAIIIDINNKVRKRLKRKRTKDVDSSFDLNE